MERATVFKIIPGIALIIALVYIATAHAEGPSGDETRLKAQAAASCRTSSSWSVEDCYFQSLKGYRGHPRDLLQIDVRDAVAYCAHVGESDDFDFCNEMHEGYQALFDEITNRAIEAARSKQQQREAEQSARPQTEQSTRPKTDMDAALQDLAAHRRLPGLPDLKKPVFVIPQSLICESAAALANPNTQFLIWSGNCIVADRKIRVSVFPPRGSEEYLNAHVFKMVSIGFRSAEISNGNVFTGWVKINSLEN